jgi:hypothetical protein
LLHAEGENTTDARGGERHAEEQGWNRRKHALNSDHPLPSIVAPPTRFGGTSIRSRK